MTNTIYINAFGITCPLGEQAELILQGLLAGDPSAMLAQPALLSGRSTVVGPVTINLPTIPAPLLHYKCRNNQLLLNSYQQIEAKVEQAKQQFGAQRIAVILGSSTAGIAEGEQALTYKAEHGKYPDGFDYLQQELGSVSAFVAELAQVSGPVYTISTACSSSGKAFASASRLLAADVCDAVIVGGADSLCQLTLNGFDALESLSPDLCNPFSINRQGINIGEGSALFLLSKQPADIALLGAGESSDAYHISAPDPSGEGAKRAINAALSQAGLRPEQVGYINLHGTATPKNDEMESRVVNQIFGENLPCSSTKPLVGHSLGAAGAIELGFCCLLLSDLNTDKKCPPQVWDQQSDPELAHIHLATSSDVLSQAVCMSNNFAFGGSNVSLIISRQELIKNSEPA